MHFLSPTQTQGNAIQYRVQPCALQGHVVEVPMHLAPFAVQDKSRRAKDATKASAYVVEILEDGTCVLQFFGHPHPQDFAWRHARHFTLIGREPKAGGYYPLRETRPASEIKSWGFEA